MRSWSIRPKPLALISPGRDPLVIPVREIGRGKFSVALRGTEGFMKATVFLITFSKSKEKEIFSRLAGQSPHLPLLTKVGKVKAGKHSWTLFQAPYYRQRLSASNRRIARVMQRCFDKLDVDDRFFKKPHKVLWPDMARPLMRAIRDCVADGQVPPSVLYALDVVLRHTKRGQYFFEFQDQNLAQDDRGNLILLDVLVTMDSDSPEGSDSLVRVPGL